MGNVALNISAQHIGKLGFTSIPNDWQFDNKLKELQGAVPPNIKRGLNQLKKQIERSINLVENLEKETK